MSIRNIVIVGGGTAGWMTAAAFARFAQKGLANVTLVESEDVGIVGVGEATIPPFLGFNKLIGVKDADMLAAVGGTFKLGIQFVNWAKQGDSYFHPFGNYGYEIEGVPFHQIWHKLRRHRDPRPLYLFNIETLAAQYAKFAITNPEARPDLPPVNYAYHIDAVKYGQFLRAFSEARGVKRIEGLIEDSALNPETGFVESVTLKDGQTVEGDFFIDCSGFRGLLIEQALETGYEDWTHWLPCDRAWAVQSEQPDGPLPYTRATAHSAGWQWRVPLQHRLGNGHVFCSQYMADDEALKILLDNLDGEPTIEPRLLRFVTGHRKKFWNKNVVAIGLSSGFMEPLESTSIHLIHSAINKLMLLFSLEGVQPEQEEIFNRLSLKEFRKIRDFLVLHYNATSRDDSEFWNYCRTMDVPDSLTEKIELFRMNGQFFREEDELFTVTSWAAVMLGQGIQPRTYSPLVDALDQDEMLKEVGEMEKSIKFVVSHMPTHAEFLQKYCPASAPGERTALISDRTLANPPPLRINPNAEVRLHDIGDGSQCAIVDDVLENPESLIDFAVQNASRFEWWSVPPGPRLIVGDDALQDLRRLIRSKFSRHFPIHSTGIELWACLSNITVPPEELSHYQRMCHRDRAQVPGTRYYAGLIYLFRNPDLGGTAFYRWKKPEVMEEAERLHNIDPAAAVRYLDGALEIFRHPPQYMTASNDLAELLTVVPARYNRLVFYDGASAHNGYILHPELLTDDLSKGRLTLNFFSTAHAR